MKKVFLAFSLVITSAAFAKTTHNPGEHLLKTILQGRKATTVSGKTNASEPCMLVIRNTSDGAYNLAVVKLPTSVFGSKAQPPSDFSDDFVGLKTAGSQEEYSSSRVRFVSQHSWGNRSKHNSIELEVREGAPVYATGVSDITSIVCWLH